MRVPVIVRTIVLLVAAFGSQSMSVAGDGDPLAVRRWPRGLVTIETHWGLQLALDSSGGTAQQLQTRPDHTVSQVAEIDHVLTRQPNATKATWLDAGQWDQVDPNAIRVKTTQQLGNTNSLLIEVDGVRIVYIPPEWFTTLGKQDSVEISAQGIHGADLMIFATAGAENLSSACCVSLINAVGAKSLMLAQFDSNEAWIAPLRSAIKVESVVTHLEHNTFALSHSVKQSPMQIVLMSDRPWEMPEELAGLFRAMEKSNSDSQAVFAKLSVKQLNFRPANGTHTPRWNTEHMMGRQLLFFSQIYHQHDSSIPVIDLNPKQMPPDYEFAHPNWDGAEEARQMQRVSDFTRRFAYLLNDVELDKKAPGSRWTLRGLLEQMQRHYGEHTANTVKKFELPGWPENQS